MFKKIKYINLRIKIIVMIFFILISFSFIAVNIIERNVNKKTLEMAETYLNNIQFMIESSLENLISKKNYESIRFLLEGMIDKIALVSVNIYDTKGNLNHVCLGCKTFRTKNVNFLYSEKTLNKLHDAFTVKRTVKKINIGNKQIVSLFKPYKNKTLCKNCHAADNQVLAVLNVNIEITEFIKFFRERIETVRNLLLVLIIIVTLIIFFILNYLIIKPIKQLEHGMQKVSKGNLNTRVVISSKDELERLAKYFNIMVHSLNKATNEINRMHQNLIYTDRLMTIGQLTAAISHEIKNPLNSIMLNADILQIKCSNCSAKENIDRYLNNIINDSEKIKKIVDQTLSFSKSQTYQLDEICLDEFTDRLEMYVKQIIFNNSNVNFKVKKVLGSCLHRIRFNRIKLEQIFINLIKNAVEACDNKKDAFVEITVDIENDFAIFAVKDNCKGIPKEALPHIFKEFYTTKTGGTGLGLSIVKDSLEEQGVEYFIETKEDLGTSFVMKFPLIEEDL